MRLLRAEGGTVLVIDERVADKFTTASTRQVLDVMGRNALAGVATLDGRGSSLSRLRA